MNDMDKEETETLYRVDERTKMIDGRLNEFIDMSSKNNRDTELLRNKVSRNTTIINGLIAVSTLSLSAIIANIVGYITF